MALSVAAAGDTHVERLQCYRGVTEDKAIGRFDEGLQRLYMEFSKGQHENWQTVQANLKGRDFFRPGPLMRALECERPCVLLIDELDKVDDGFEAMLLEILSAWQLSIPEFGTVVARSIRDSYQPLVELMGGEMIEMSLDSEQTINPWDLPRGESKPSNDQISFLKNLTRHMLGENTPPDLDIDLLDSVLLEAIASTYKRCSAKTSNLGEKGGRGCFCVKFPVCC